MFLSVLILGLISITSAKYVFVNKSLTWPEAQRYCRDKYTDLVTINNEEETVQLLDTVKDDSVDLVWIGLYDDLTSWKWTLENSDFFEAGEENFRNWNNQGPSYYGTQYTCVHMEQGFWYTTYCFNGYPFICYDGRNGSVSYVLVNQYRNWADARSYCRQYYTDLVSIRNEAENQKIQYLYRSYGYGWIGLYRPRSWSDRSNSSFTYWSYGQPDTDGTCAAVSFSNSGQWTDENCNTVMPFICYNGSTSRQFFFVNESKNWTEAQRVCRQNYTDLATIENMEEMNRLINTVNGSYSGSAWIGLYDDLNGWRWSLEDNAFYQEGERDFRNWVHQPDNYGGKELCVWMDSNGKWYDFSCDSTLQFMCYDGRVNASQKYIKGYNYLSWAEARRFCRDHYTDLVNVRNQTENQKILELTGGNIFIGLYRNRTWSNSQTSTYENWRPAIPDSYQQPDNPNYYYYYGYNYGYYFNEYYSERCTAVSFSHLGRWTDERCSSNLPFICYNRKCSQSSCSRQYYFVNVLKSWDEAQKYCRENYTDLATIDNKEEMNRAFKTARGTFYGKAWIGLYDDLTSWKWSLDNATILGGFQSWYVREQRNSGGSSLCVYMASYSGIWSEFPCQYALHFVCYDGRINATAEYVFVYQSKNWTDAQSYCREHHTDLVSIRNETENKKLYSLFGGYDYWIGLYRTRSWSDQSNSTFSIWQPGQPDNAGSSQYCTALSFPDNGSWSDENCLTALPFLCYSMSASSSRQFFFVNESKNWTEAQRVCRQNYTDLATIENMVEMNRLIDTVNGSYSGSAWIGLYDDVNSWRWSLEDNAFYQEGERDFRNWFHEPTNQGKEMCVYMDSNGKWFDDSCDNYRPFACYNGSINSTQRFIVVYESRTWSGAQSYCRDQGTDLASVTSETEQQQTRVWSDQSSSSFTYWLPYTGYVNAQPDNGVSVSGEQGGQHCTAVSLTYFGQWTDESCYASLPFFCYSDEYVMGMRIQVTSLQYLSKSQIEELVILKLQEKLGVTNNVTMHLRDYHEIQP
ncbi:hypothetical protein DNTS_034543 [Danionella cerebrum]|uniref:C-type lectin domain-containing protein n=1 Tax=Danionella cerebrum TaxID=2873325 RepID=A0A553QF49_9TELE|nr:hypothetical protein DNTS_034543 [Danionella translucida]